MSDRLLGWDMGLGDLTCVLIGSVTKKGVIKVKKTLHGKEAEDYLHSHLRQVNRILQREAEHHKSTGEGK